MNTSVERSASIFCLPYAGGSSLAYRDWKVVHPAVDVVTLDYPGHLLRPDEDLLSDMDVLVSKLWDELLLRFSEPYALVGSSMGALVGLELARKGALVGMPPRMLVVVGCASPTTLPNAPLISEFSDSEFLRVFCDRYGVDRSVTTDHDLSRELLPMFRADMRVYEKYACLNSALIDIDILAIHGSKDEIAMPGDVKRWQEVTTGAFSDVSVDSGHFMIEDAAEVIEVIREQVLPRLFMP